MPSAYLQGADIAAFGVPSATAPEIAAASLVIDGYLRRPEGLVYAPDAAGNPAYMSALEPGFSLTVTTPITAGTAVSATVSGPVGMIQVGTPLVLDRNNTAAVETCVVTGISGNTITFGAVQFAHAADVAADAGMLILEQKVLPQGRPLTILAKAPVVQLIAGQGRYGYGRHGSQNNFNLDDFNLLAAVTKFGGPPVWENFQINAAGVDTQTGQLWVPAGIMLAYYSEVRIHYVAGFQYSNLPATVKQACANIINAMASSPLNGNFKMQKAGDTALERFASTLLDGDTMAMLNPYRARAFG